MDSISQILIVDDDSEICTLLAEYLENNSYRSFTAQDGTAMMKTVCSERIDLIVLDLNLPGEDGLTLCRTLVPLQFTCHHAYSTQRTTRSNTRLGDGSG